MTAKNQKPKLNPVIYEEAADWIVELREGEVDAATRERLDRWFRESPRHIRAYLELSSIWEEGADPDLDRAHTTEQLISLVRSASNIFPLQIRARTSDLSIEEAQATDGLAPRPGASARIAEVARRRFRWAWVSAGAVACATAMLSVYVYAERNITFTTTTGEQRFEKLIDGSTIELNSRSKVRIRFSGRERNVDLLEGQALFHVAKDATRPFIVHSDSTLVRAVGTQFDVYRSDSGTTVTVVEGRVAVLSPLFGRGRASETAAKPDAYASLSGAPAPVVPKLRSEPRAMSGETGTAASLPSPVALTDDRGAVFLNSGDQLTVGAQGSAAPTHADAAAAIAWTHHELVFDATPLSDVAREFNRYNSRELLIEDPTLRSLRITGVFSSADASSLLKFLRAQNDIIVRETDEDIRIVKK